MWITNKHKINAYQVWTTLEKTQTTPSNKMRVFVVAKEDKYYIWCGSHVEIMYGLGEASNRRPKHGRRCTSLNLYSGR